MCLIVAAVVLGAALGVATAGDELLWWQAKPIYQIYPSAFKDSDANGFGDLRGITDKVKYLTDLGVGGVWLGPIFPNSYYDGGYDITNYTDIHPSFGTFQDFDDLLHALNSSDSGQKIRLLLDFVPNHTSDEHPWFNCSVYKQTDCDDFYVWADGKDGNPPNNWLSVFGGSAWEYHKVRGQYYYHAFSKHQPDLNYRSEKLKKNITEVLEFWMKKGVMGFRVDAVRYLVEDDKLRDEPVLCPGNDYNCRDHNKTVDQSETFNVLSKFRETIDKFDGKDKRLMVLEAYSPMDKIMEYYKHGNSDVAQMPFNFLLITNITKDSKGKDYVNVVNTWMKNMPSNMWPNWVTGNHDNSRVGSRMGEMYIDAMNMINLLLPGTPFIYYGEEIGMQDVAVRPDQTVDTIGRDPERTPMQWDDTLNAGFSSMKEKTWLPLNPNYWRLNVKKQENDENSHLKIVKRLIKLQNDIAANTSVNATDFNKDYQFAFMRYKNNSEKYLVLVNLNDRPDTVNVSSYYEDLPNSLLVHTASLGSQHKIGSTVKGDGVELRGGEGLVLSTGVVSDATFILPTVTLLFTSLLIALH